MSVHHLQSWPDSCIAAAMCMIQRWRGEVPTETAFHQGNPSRDPGYVTALPRVEYRSVDPDTEHELRLDLRRGRLVVVMVLVRNYEGWRSAAYPHLQSPHGRLVRGHHMVVLCDGTRDGFRLLDPFFLPAGQPLDVSDDDFVRWFAGAAYIARP